MKKLKKIKLVSIGLSAVMALTPLSAGLFPPAFAEGSNHVKIVVRTVDGQAIPNATLAVDEVGYQTPRFNLNSSGRYSYDKNGQYGSSATALKTNGQGYADLNGLPNGDYTFDFVSTDTKSSAGPVQESFHGQSKQVELKAAVNSGAISLTYTKATGEALSGAVFCLEKGSSKIPVAKIPSEYIYGVGGSTDISTNTEGKFTISNVPAGEYSLVQIKGPSDLKLASQNVSVTKGQISKVSLSSSTSGVTSSQNKIPATQTDLLNAAPSSIIPSAQGSAVKRGNLRLHIIDSVTKAPVAGYKFAIDSDTFIQKDSSESIYEYGDKSGTETTVVSDSNGYILINNMPEGKVSIKQSAAASGYALNLSPVSQTVVSGKTTSYDFKVTASGYSILVNNTKNVGIKNVLLEIFNKNNAVVLAGETNEKGILQISGLTEGNYKIKVENVPSGYMNLSDTVSMTIDASGKVTNFKPIILKASVVYLQSDCLTSGFQFSLKNSETGKILTAATNSTGIATVTNIPQGKYEITETAAPKGVKVSSEKKYANIDGKYSAPLTVKFKNAASLVNDAASNQSLVSSDSNRKIWNFVVLILVIAATALASVVLVKARKTKKKNSEEPQKRSTTEIQPCRSSEQDRGNNDFLNSDLGIPEKDIPKISDKKSLNEQAEGILEEENRNDV